MSEADILPAEDKMEVDESLEQPTAEEAAMDDLFGDDNAVVQQQRQVSTPDEREDTEEQEQLSAAEMEHRRQMEYAEEEEEEDNEPPLREAGVSIPSIPKVRSSDGQCWVLRLPNFIKLDSRPFHPQTYVGPEHHEEEGGTVNARERSMSIKLQVENTMRWRWGKDRDGSDIKQSNCRIIRWSDGSQTLLLGKEQFEVVKNVDTSAAPPQTSPSKSKVAEPNSSKYQGLTYLVAQHARSTILQVEAPVTGTLTLRPMGMQSETHQMLVRAVGQKHNRVARLKMAPDPIRDPEREKLEQLKSQTKKTRKRRERDDDDGLGTPTVSRKRTGFLNRKRTSERLWSDEEEEEEPAYGSDGSDEERRARQPRASGKHTGEYQTDDFVVSDEEDEGEDGDGEGSPGKRKKRRGSDAEEEARDSLDEMEEKIEAESRRRKKKGGAEADSKPAAEKAVMEEEGEPEVDIESEDEDEDEVIRRRKPTRPKVIVEEDEEE